MRKINFLIFVLILLITLFYFPQIVFGAFNITQFFIQPSTAPAPCNAQLSLQVQSNHPPPNGYKVTYDCGTGDGQGCVHDLPGQRSIVDICICHYPTPGVYTATVTVKSKNSPLTRTASATFTATDSGCTDTDSDVNHYDGKDYDEFGTCQDASGSHSDQCTPSGTLTEYYCKSGTCKTKNKTCSGGKVCSGGACVAPSCNDPDGNDITQQTTCTDASGSHTDRCTPGPMGAVQVDEYVCSGGNCVIQSQMCPAGQFCQNGACVAAGPVCGNGVCEPGETPANCPADCGGGGSCNNDGTCDAAAGENHSNCPNDCPCDYDGVCELTQGENNFNCTDCMGGGGSSGSSTALTATSVAKIISNFGDFLFKIAIGLVVILIIVAALYFVLAGSDPTKLEIAKKIFFYTLIGLFIVLLAGGIVAILRTIISS